MRGIVADPQQITVSPAENVLPLRPPAPGLAELVSAVRAVVTRHADWHRTADLVAAVLRRHLPSPDCSPPTSGSATPSATAAICSTASPTGRSRSSPSSGGRGR